MGNVSCFPFPPGRERPQQPQVPWKKVSGCSISPCRLACRGQKGYWEEGPLAAFIPWSAMGAGSGAPEIPRGSHERLLLLEKWEQIQSCGTGLVKLRPWESRSAASHIVRSQVLRLVLISRSVLELCRRVFAKLVGFGQITKEFKPAPFGMFAAELEGVCRAWLEMSREVPQENKILGLDVLDVSLHGCRKTLRGSH